MREVHAEKLRAPRRLAIAVRELISSQRTREVEVPTHRTPKGLPKEVPSICPECKTRVQATLYENNGQVYMRKSCPSHGVFEDLIYGDVEMYLKMERWTFGDAEGIENPKIAKSGRCPEDCGLCSRHLSTACMTIVDLTNRCNLDCPYCFASANAAGYDYTVSREQITYTLEKIHSVRPQRCKTIQYSGGEPTLHPDFLWAVSEVKRVGFPYVMAASNGIIFGKSVDFTRRAKAAGLDAVYLQFDGVSEEVYERTRGARIGDLKFRCIENCKKAGIRVVLVPTVARGVNEGEIGAIVRAAIDHLDAVNGVSFQPVAFTGRISYEDRIRERFTLSDLAWAIYDQTGLVHPMKDWYPLSFVSPLSRLAESLSGRPIMTISCHSDCGIGTYLIINRKGEAYPITRFIDVEGAMAELNAISGKLRSILQRPIYFAQAIRIMRKYYRPECAPPGFSFSDFLGALGPTMIRTRSHVGKTREWRFLIVLAMHFQDAYNYNMDRIRRCVIHYGAPDGNVYSFCTYNSGPTYREKVEAEFSKPIHKH